MATMIEYAPESDRECTVSLTVREWQLICYYLESMEKGYNDLMADLLGCPEENIVKSFIDPFRYSARCIVDKIKAETEEAKNAK